MNVEWNHRPAADARLGLLASDTLFAERADCLDLDLVVQLLARAFPGLDTSNGLQLANVWYIPGKSLQVVYRVPPTDRGDETVFRVQFHPKGHSGRYAALAGATAGDPDRVRHLPELDAVASLFPEDPELSQMETVLTARYLQTQVKARGSRRLLSYLPGRRCAVRYECSDDPNGIVLRVQRPSDAAQSHARVHAAWRASGHVRMPEPLGYDAEAGAMWERFVPGRRLDVLVGTGALGPALDSVITGLVKLHALAIDDLPAEGTNVVLNRTVSKVIPKIRTGCPGLSRELDAFSALLTARAPRGDSTAATLHGDLHTANLLLEERGVVFIDLDRMAKGHPAYDLALLGTRLLLVALDARANVSDVATAIETLPDRYRASGGAAISQQTFAWYVAALLVGRQVKTVVRHLAPNAARIAPVLLGCAAATLERGRLAGGALSVDRHEVCGVC